jgi:hypothetical protein
MQFLQYDYQYHSLYRAQTLCMGTLDGGPCGREARIYGRSQALLQLVSCGGRLSERSYQILAKWLLCERCQHQTDQAQRWLDALAFTVLKKQTLLEFHNHEEWVTARFNEIVRGRHQMQAELWPRRYRTGPGAVLLDNDIHPAQKEEE